MYNNVRYHQFPENALDEGPVLDFQDSPIRVKIVIL